MNLKPKTITPNIGLVVTLSLPATPVLTTAEAKTALRVDFTTDDTFIDSLVASATLLVQKFLNRALINQTVIAEWDSVGSEIVLPYAPIGAIASVVTVADDGTETALTANSGYYVRNGVLKTSTAYGLKATYTAGYGATSADVPQAIRTAVERLTLSMYDRRDDEVLETNVQQLDFGTKAILQPYVYIK